MLITVLILLTIIVLHVTGPFQSFLKPELVHAIETRMVITSLLHGILEEYVLRHLYWKHLAKSPKNRASMIWLNVLVFWFVHILLVYISEYNDDHHALRTYSSVSYNLSIVFAGMALNAIYLDTGRHALFNCIVLHVTMLLVWSIFLGGSNKEYYSKYNVVKSPSVQRVRSVFGTYVRDTLSPLHASLRQRVGGRSAHTEASP